MSFDAIDAPPAAGTLAPAIHLSGVHVAFEGRAVLRDVNLDVAPGEFVALIGPSGGGKSTLLRVVAGLLGADGRVEVRGQPAVVFQDYRLLPWRTVRQNVGLPRELTGRGDDPDEVLRTVGMLEHARLYPHQLSGGMRARVAIARALAQDAEVLLMDEPFAALDALVRERFNLELKRLHRKTGKTIVFVTHSIREAVYLADRVAVLKDGRLEAVLDARGEGRLTAFTDGLEAELRARLGVADSTMVRRPPRALRVPWEAFSVAALAVIALSVWSAVSARLGPLFFPSPAQVWVAGVQNAALLSGAAVETLRVMLIGLLVSLAVGAPVGYAMGRSRAVERVLSPFIVALQAIPTVVVAPLLVVLLGYGLGSRVVITALISLYPVLVSAMVGVREVDRVFREVFRTIGARSWGIFSKLEVPGALPVVLGGLRLTVSLALIGTFVGEFVLGAPPPGQGGPGLGYLAFTERNNLRVANAFAAVAVNVVLGGVLYLLVALLEAWVLRYRRR